MDLATLIGMVSGFILIYVTIILGSPFMLFVNIPSIFCVFGGTLAALLINFPMSSVMSMVVVMMMPAARPVDMAVVVVGMIVAAMPMIDGAFARAAAQPVLQTASLA